jgi:hypothetical protein
MCVRLDGWRSVTVVVGCGGLYLGFRCDPQLLRNPLVNRFCRRQIWSGEWRPQDGFALFRMRLRQPPSFDLYDDEAVLKEVIAPPPPPPPRRG